MSDVRAEQRVHWNAIAPTWRKWSEQIEAAARHISERMVELAAIKPGNRVLDVAAGLGEPTLAAARRVGPSGRVVATDISGEMLGFARERAAAAGLHNIDFVESDAASLSFPEASFEAALSRWGIIFDPDAEAAVARIRTLLKPRAHMCLASWGPRERVPLQGIPMRVFSERFDLPPPDDTTGPFSRPTPKDLAALLERGGFAEVEVEDAEVTFAWESPEQYVLYVQEMSPRTLALIASQPQELQEDAWNALTAEIRAFTQGSGRVRLSNQALLAVGRA
jgi:ubiquinone/menaquinone biosynthesis C-methylase UbiE